MRPDESSIAITKEEYYGINQFYQEDIYQNVSLAGASA